MNNAKELHRPPTVSYFLYAFIGTIILGVLDILLLYVGLIEQTSELATLTNFFIGTFIMAVFVWFSFIGKNWARITYSILLALCVPFVVIIITDELSGDLIGAASSSIQVILGILSIYWLFTKQSNSWFSEVGKVDNI